MKSYRFGFLPYLLILTSGLSAVSCYTKQCYLKKEDWPEIRGIKLGMTFQQMQATYPYLPDLEPNKYGLARLIFEPDPGLSTFNVTRRLNMEIMLKELAVTALVMDRPFSELKGVKQLRVDFFDDKVALVQVYYEDLAWSSLETFFQQSIQKLRLPGDVGWETAKDGQSKHILCRCENPLDGMGLEIEIGFGHPNSQMEKRLPYVNLTDWDSWEMGPSRRKWQEEKVEQQKQEEQQKGFKP